MQLDSPTATAKILALENRLNALTAGSASLAHSAGGSWNPAFTASTAMQGIIGPQYSACPFGPTVGCISELHLFGSLGTTWTGFNFVFTYGGGVQFAGQIGLPASGSGLAANQAVRLHVAATLEWLPDSTAQGGSLFTDMTGFAQSNVVIAPGVSAVLKTGGAAVAAAQAQTLPWISFQYTASGATGVLTMNHYTLTQTRIASS